MELSTESLSSFGVPSRDLIDQRQIADFLEHQVSRIDQVVQVRRTQMKLLEEAYRAQLLSDIFGNVDLRGDNLRFPWPLQFIEVPTGWAARRVQSLFKSGRGRVISHEDILQAPGPYPVFSSQTEANGKMGSIASFDFDGECLTWTTDGANAGTVFRRTGRFNCTNVCGTLHAREPLNYEYMKHALNSVTSFYVRHDINPKLMNDVMSSITLPVPSLQDQDRIADTIGGRRLHLDKLKSLILEQVELLQERKRALIIACVTGEFHISSASNRAAEAVIG